MYLWLNKIKIEMNENKIMGTLFHNDDTVSNIIITKEKNYQVNNIHNGVNTTSKYFYLSSFDFE